jgi:putative addiction module killer protein
MRSEVATAGFFVPHLGQVAAFVLLRIDYRPGYRIYFLRRGPETVLLLCGGDKTTQDRDIRRAKELAKEDRDGS